jgi:hypothetical protein
MLHTTPVFANSKFDTMYPLGLVDRIHHYEPRFRTIGTSSADSVTRPQLTKPTSISRFQFVKEYHIPKSQHLIGRHQTSLSIAVAQQALQFTKSKAFMGTHPQQEDDYSTENEATMETTSQTEQQEVDNSNLSASNQDQGNFGTTTIPCKRTLSEDESEQYISGRIKRMRRGVDVPGYSDLDMNNGELIIMERSQPEPTSTNQQTSETQSTPIDTKSDQNICLNDIKSMRERIERLKRNQRLQKYFEKQSTPTRTESRQRIENWLDNLSTPLEVAIEWGIEEAIQEAIETATDAPIETQEIVNTIAQGILSDDRAEENYDHQGQDDDQEDIDIILGRISLSEACSRDENNSQDEDNDQQSDNHNGHDDGNSQEADNSQEGDSSKEDGNNEEDDNVSDLDDDEQDTESTNSEESDDTINEEAGLSRVIRAIRATHDNENGEEDDVLEDSDLDIDEDDLEPMIPEDIEGANNEMGGYALVYSASQADNEEPAQNEPQQRIRVPLGEITQHELQQRDNQQQAPEEVQAEDPNANGVRTQRVRIFLRHNMFRSEEEPANEEEEEMQDTIRDFQVEQLVEEAELEPQPLRRSERIRRRGERQEQEQNEEDWRENLPPHTRPQNYHPIEIDGQEFDYQPGVWIFNGTFENMNWTFASDMMRD